jgi:cytochrome c biogenesis protein CcdA
MSPILTSLVYIYFIRGLFIALGLLSVFALVRFFLAKTKEGVETFSTILSKIAVVIGLLLLVYGAYIVYIR